MPPEAAVSGATGGTPAAVVAQPKVEAGNPASGVGANTSGIPGAPAWHPDATPADIAHYASKGLDKLDANAAVRAYSQSYQNLEKLIGADKAGNTVVLPGETAEQSVKDAFYTRLGRPASADKYGVDVKTIAGMDEHTAKEFLDVAHKNGLTTNQVKGMAEWNNTKATAIRAQLAENARIEGAQQTEKLKQEWGAAFDQNVQIVNEVAAKFGFNAETMQKLKAVFGVDGAMKFLHNQGVKTGESRYIGGDTGGRGEDPNGAMSPAQADIALKKLMASPEFKTAMKVKEHPDHAKMIARKSQLVAWSVGTASQAR